ncbi:MAG TPA: M23 family metallopeptidase [Anaeromyxobacteraceae bacterium]|nr:M23 family metallopeptidase [Anaeromyxobacteraceae bacterium]
MSRGGWPAAACVLALACAHHLPPAEDELDGSPHRLPPAAEEPPASPPAEVPRPEPPAPPPAPPPPEATHGPAAPEPPGGLEEQHVEPDLVGVFHLVRKGETLYRIARSYGVAPKELMEVNGVKDPQHLEVGSELFIPGASRSVEVPPLPGSASPEREVTLPEREPPAEAGPAPRPGRAAPLSWPVRGVLYSRFGVRQGQRHDGIDIAAPEGTSVGAAAKGTVVYAGEQSGYGSIVILRHDQGLMTLYAHASTILVHPGERVAAGQPIARVGHSGRTTGPHLHFEVREGTRPRNPLLYLP